MQNAKLHLCNHDINLIVVLFHVKLYIHTSDLSGRKKVTRQMTTKQLSCACEDHIGEFRKGEIEPTSSGDCSLKTRRPASERQMPGHQYLHENTLPISDTVQESTPS
jgi:hypothetical protein